MGNIKLVFLVFIAFFFLTVAPLASAQSDAFKCPEGLNATVSGVKGLCFPADPVNSQLTKDSPTKIITNIITILLQFAGIVAVIFMIYGGYLLMTSAGNEETATKGKRTLMYSLLGLVVVMLAYAIVTFVARTIIRGDIGT